MIICFQICFNFAFKFKLRRYAEAVFTTIFVLECVIKVIAMGTAVPQ